MSHFFSWIANVPLVIGVAATVYVPGFLVMRAARFSRVVAVVLAPAMTFAIVGVSAIAFDLAGLRWNVLTFVAASLLAIALAGAVGHCCEPGPTRSFRFGPAQWPDGKLRQIQWPIGIAIAFLVIPTLFLTDPAVPSSQADPMFHNNAVNAVIKTGNASTFGAMSPMYGIQAIDTSYPSVWHALVAVLGTGAIMPASHALAYVIIPVIAVISLVFFVRTSLPDNPTAWAIAPVVLLAMPYFPNFLTISRGFWPNSLALAVVPALLGFGLLAIRNATSTRRREAIVLALVFLGALAGLGFTHPGAVFSLLWPIFPVVLLSGVVAVVRAVRERRLTRSRGLAIGGLAVFSAGSALLALHPRVQAFLIRPHPRSWNTRERLATLTSELQHVNPLLIVLAAVAGIAVITLAIIAVRTAWQEPDARWIVIAWLAQWLVVFGAYVDGNIFSTIAGIWYHDPKRLMAMQTLFTTVLAAVLIARWISSRPHRTGPIVTLTLAVSIALGVLTRVVSVYPDARPPIGPENIIDSYEEIALLEQLDQLAPPGSVILGDAATGIGYAPAYSDVNVVFPQVNFHPHDMDGWYLRRRFRDIHTDPQVCTILTSRGIGYYYEDDPIIYQNRNRSEIWPGLYGVDTTRGFTKIADTDGGTLWRIDVCGPIGEPDWWDLGARTHSHPESRE